MKNFFIFYLFYSTSCLFSLSIKAQDDTANKKNQIVLEILGNNFYDYKSSVDPGPLSLSYGRKMIFNNCSFVFSTGIGLLRAGGSTPPVTLLEFPTGILMRGKYKRNGFWFGAFFTPCFGRIAYRDAFDHQHLHNFSFQLTPNLTYQYQNKAESFFVRLSFTPKILASAFEPKSSIDKYGYGSNIFPLWGGISIGGAW